MKQLFLSLALIATVALTAAAKPTPVAEPSVEKTFSQIFAGASHVTWSKEDGQYMKASFLWGEHQTIAYFENNGRLIGSIRGLFFNQLPLTVIRMFNSEFAGHTVIEVREISNEEGTSYSLVTESKDKKYKLRLSAQGNLLDKERVKK